jgi:hypothetical protein
VGSAITYARRYGLAAILGIHQEDDDANTFVKSEPATNTADMANLISEYDRLMSVKELNADDKVGIPEQWQKAVLDANALIMSKIIKKLAGKPDNVDVVPDAKSLQIECADKIKKLMDGNIDGFGTDTRRHNAFTKHLGTDTLRDCPDIEKLTAFSAYLTGKLEGGK